MQAKPECGDARRFETDIAMPHSAKANSFFLRLARARAVSHRAFRGPFARVLHSFVTAKIKSPVIFGSLCRVLPRSLKAKYPAKKSVNQINVKHVLIRYL
jgi:hypothetical protein